jgi:hypothetical protein
MAKQLKRISLGIAVILVLVGILISCSGNGGASIINTSEQNTANPQTTATGNDTPTKQTDTESPASANDPAETSTQNPTKTDTPKPTAIITPRPVDTVVPTETIIPQADDVLPVLPTEKMRSIVGLAQSGKVKKAEDFTQATIDALVRSAVDYAGGLKGIVKDGDTVVLKPNLVIANDYTLPGWKGLPLNPEVNGNCTDYRFTRAVAKLIREINPSGKIYVMEGSAQDTEEVMKALNYSKKYIVYFQF